jgi:hypothetical protein
MRKVVLLATAGSAVLGLTGLTGSGPVRADTYPGGLDGCVAASHGASVPNASGGAAGSGNVVNQTSCSFVAAKRGGFAAVGADWAITVYDRADPATRRVVYHYTTANRTGPAHPLWPSQAPNVPTPCRFPAYSQGQYVEARATNGVVYLGDAVYQASNVDWRDSCQWGEGWSG